MRDAGSQRESNMRYILLSLVFIAGSVHANDVCSIVRGAKLIAQDNEKTYLGEITNRYASNSIFNEYGNYGSKYSSNSIWNEFTTFGSEYSYYSPFNEYTSTPPMIIKNRRIVGYLTANKTIGASVSPDALKVLCEDNL